MVPYRQNRMALSTIMKLPELLIFKFSISQAWREILMRMTFFNCIHTLWYQSKFNKLLFREIPQHYSIPFKLSKRPMVMLRKNRTVLLISITGIHILQLGKL